MMPISRERQLQRGKLLRVCSRLRFVWKSLGILCTISIAVRCGLILGRWGMLHHALTSAFPTDDVCIHAPTDDVCIHAPTDDVCIHTCAHESTHSASIHAYEHLGCTLTNPPPRSPLSLPHLYTRTNLHTCLHTCAHAYTQISTHHRTHTGKTSITLSSQPSPLVHRHKSTHLLTYMHTCTSTGMNTCIHQNLHTSQDTHWQTLHHALLSAFPMCTDLSKDSQRGITRFSPHLSVGGFPGLHKLKQVERLVSESWDPIEFDVASVYLISRSGHEEPFTVRWEVPLGGNATQREINLAYVAAPAKDSDSERRDTFEPSAVAAQSKQCTDDAGLRSGTVVQSAIDHSAHHLGIPEAQCASHTSANHSDEHANDGVMPTQNQSTSSQNQSSSEGSQWKSRKQQRSKQWTDRGSNPGEGTGIRDVWAGSIRRPACMEHTNWDMDGQLWGLFCRGERKSKFKS
jgi:hypothetical protein